MAFERRTLFRFALLLPVVLLTLSVSALAQDPTGRPTEPGQDPTGRPTEPKNPKKKPPKTTVRRTEPGAATVTLTVLTDPPETSILVDGNQRGTSNAEGKLVLDRMKLGQYTIEARKDGFRAMTRTFSAGTEAPTLVFKLEPDLDRYVAQFDSLVNTGHLVPPDNPNAAGVVNDLTARYPDRPEVQRMRGVLAARLADGIAPVITNSATNWNAVSHDDLSKAADAANTALTFRKDDNRLRAEAAYLKGAIIYRDWQGSAGDPSGLAPARTEFENATRADDAFAPAHLLLGMVLTTMGEWAGAETEFSKVSQLEPHWTQATVSLGKVYYNQNRYKDAMDAYRRALQAEPQNINAMSGLGLARVMKGEKDGVKDIERATQLDPMNATAQLNLGLALSQSKDKKQRQRAEQALQKAIELNAKSAEFPARVAQQALDDLQKKKK